MLNSDDEDIAELRGCPSINFDELTRDCNENSLTTTEQNYSNKTSLRKRSLKELTKQ